MILQVKDIGFFLITSVYLPLTLYVVVLLPSYIVIYDPNLSIDVIYLFEQW
jgi:hypothetical protein